jgi:hypothetical protein
MENLLLRFLTNGAGIQNNNVSGIGGIGRVETACAQSCGRTF